VSHDFTPPSPFNNFPDSALHQNILSNHNSVHFGVAALPFNTTMVHRACTDAIKAGKFREGINGDDLLLRFICLWMNWKLTLVLMANFCR